MKYIIITFLCFCQVCNMSAQVGINTINLTNLNILHIDSKNDNPDTGTINTSESDNDVIISTDGNLSIGTTSSTYKLNLIKEPTVTNDLSLIKVVDGGQNIGNILKSDASGVAKWGASSYSISRAAKFPHVEGVPPSNYLSLPITTGAFLSSGTTLTLLPGIWMVYVSIVLRADGGVGGVFPAGLGATDLAWIRSSFTDGVLPVGQATASISPDFVGRNSYVATLVYKNALYQMLSGQVVINNSTAAEKTYTYVVGGIINYGGNTQTVFGQVAFGSSSEDSIVAFKYQ